MTDERKPLIVLTGPTAVGKTALSVALAGRIGGEIISADSMQVYRYMDIGSAKIRPEEMKGIPHHLIDFLDPREEFHVVRFQQEAKRAMEGIYDRKRIPIIAGGTGFYIQALIRNIDFTENAETPGIRKRLEERIASGEEETVYRELQAVDPEAAWEIHPHNHRRVIRALEFYYLSGEKISEHNRREKEKKSPYRLLYLVLNREREELYRRIDERVDLMLQEGLVEEVCHLKEMGCSRSLVSMQGLGYKEILTYLDGECSLEEAVRTLKRDTRHFAKRQLTWFRREKEAVWLNVQEYKNPEEILERILVLAGEKGILCDGNSDS